LTPPATAGKILISFAGRPMGRYHVSYGQEAEGSNRTNEYAET
jgi:hypothetical protein